MNLEERQIRYLPAAVSVLFALLSSLAAYASARSQGAGRAPKILLIVSDEQGYRDLGCHGGKQTRTPSLNRLATEGVRLTSFYVARPACALLRASILTARCPQRNGTYDMFRNDS